MKLSRFILGAHPRRTLIRCAVLVVLCVVIFRYGLAVLRSDGMSMEPNYSPGTLVLADRLAYVWSEPRRGDVVALRLRESGGSILYLKRIVGLPGERVGFRKGQLLINDEPKDEAYLVYESNWDREPVICGPDEYFLVGDNRSMPIRSHTFGRISAPLILGKALF